MKGATTGYESGRRALDLEGQGKDRRLGGCNPDCGHIGLLVHTLEKSSKASEKDLIISVT